jgi:hypothetical protein
MTNSHVVSALRLKRAEISGHIHDLEGGSRASGRISDGNRRIENRIENRNRRNKIELLNWIIGAISFLTAVILGALISLVRMAAK